MYVHSIRLILTDAFLILKQVLSKLEIVIPLYFIFSIFREGISFLAKNDKVPKRGSVSTQSNSNTDSSSKDKLDPKDVIGMQNQNKSFNPTIFKNTK